MDLASVVAALASVGVRVSGSTPNNNIQGDSSRACPTGLAGPEPSGTHNDPGQHFHEGTAPGAGLAGASGAGAVFTSASSFPGSILVRPSAYVCLYSEHWLYGAGSLPVHRDRLPLATRKVYSVFSTVFCLSCCLLLV